MKVKVTEKHIATGAPRASTYCPIALALREAGCKDPLVYRETVNLPSTPFNVFLPASAQQFINRFDNNEPVEPFEFELDIEETSL